MLSFVQAGMLLLLGFNTALFFFIFQTASSVRFAHINHIIYVLLLFPFVLLFPVKLIRWLGIAIVLAATFLSMKRSAFFCVIAASYVYFLVSAFVERRVSRRFKVMAGLAFFSVVMPLLVIEVDEYSGGHLTTRLKSIQSDQGSGRIEIYKGVLQLQGNASVTGWLVGHGHYAVAPDLGYGEHHSAHNDWQEVLYDYGLIGMSLYVAFHYGIIMMIKGLIKMRHPLAPAAAASYVLFFILSSVSHLVIYPSYFSYLMAFWGMTYALYERVPEGFDETRLPHNMAPL